MTTAGADVDMRESYSTYLERSAGSGDVMTDALPDIDLYDHDNPLCATEYVNDIYQYWYIVEPETQVSETYMLIQTISSWFNAITLFLFLQKKNLFSFNNIFIKRFFKIVFSSILMGLFFNYLMIIFSEQLSFENSLKSVYLILSVILGLGFYLLTSYFIKAFQLEDIKLRY